MLQNIAPLPNDCANYRAQTCTAIWHWHESILTYIPVESSRNETFVPTRNMKIVCSRLKAQKALYLCPWQFTDKPARLRQSADHARISKVVGEYIGQFRVPETLHQNICLNAETALDALDTSQRSSPCTPWPPQALPRTLNTHLDWKRP